MEIHFPKARRDDIEDEDDFDTFLKYKKELDAQRAKEGYKPESGDFSDDEKFVVRFSISLLFC